MQLIVLIRNIDFLKIPLLQLLLVHGLFSLLLMYSFLLHLLPQIQKLLLLLRLYLLLFYNLVFHQNQTSLLNFLQTSRFHRKIQILYSDLLLLQFSLHDLLNFYINLYLLVRLLLLKSSLQIALHLILVHHFHHICQYHVKI